MGDEVEMDEAANIPNDNGIPLRGMIDLPNEIFDKILNQLRPKERGKVRILSRRYKIIFFWTRTKLFKASYSDLTYLFFIS